MRNGSAQQSSLETALLSLLLINLPTQTMNVEQRNSSANRFSFDCCLSISLPIDLSSPLDLSRASANNQSVDSISISLHVFSLSPTLSLSLSLSLSASCLAHASAYHERVHR